MMTSGATSAGLVRVAGFPAAGMRPRRLAVPSGECARTGANDALRCADFRCSDVLTLARMRTVRRERGPSTAEPRLHTMAQAIYAFALIGVGLAVVAGHRALAHSACGAYAGDERRPFGQCWSRLTKFESDVGPRYNRDP